MLFGVLTLYSCKELKTLEKKSTFNRDSIMLMGGCS